MTLECSVQAFHLQVIARARPGAMSARLTRGFGISRTLFSATARSGLWPRWPDPRAAGACRGRPATLSWEAKPVILAVAQPERTCRAAPD